jgi:hypothetical protein
MNILKIIRKYNILNENEKRLSKEEEVTFYNFVKKLCSSKKAHFIYRGVCNDKLSEVFGTTADQNIQLLADYIFVLGEKGQYFIKSKVKGNWIDKNIRCAQLEEIWNKFYHKVCNPEEFSSDRTREAVKNFLDKNSRIRDYFSNQENKLDFINYGETEHATTIIDYYYALLHTIGKSGDSDSYFLSTSTDYKIADSFSNSGIILFGWLPQEVLKDETIQYSDINLKNSEILNLGLPIFTESVYPEQKEICLKCGLLPHYTIGFSYRENFYINPYTLKKWNKDVVYNGMDIDQTSFNRLISKSNYTSNYFYIDGDYYVLNSMDSKITKL